MEGHFAKKQMVFGKELLLHEAEGRTAPHHNNSTIDKPFPKAHAIGSQQLDAQCQRKDGNKIGEDTETLVHEIVGRISTERTANILCLVNFARFKSCLLLDARHKVGGEGNQHDKAIDEYQQTDDEAEHLASPGFA